MKQIKFNEIKRDELIPEILAQIHEVKTRYAHLLTGTYQVDLSIHNN